MPTDGILLPERDPGSHGPFEFNAKLDITAELVDTVVEVGGYSIAYWANALVMADDGIAVAWYDDDEKIERKNATWRDLARGLAEIAFGKGARQDLVDHARRAILEPDAGEIDGEIADVAIQYALFDEIVYG